MKHDSCSRREHGPWDFHSGPHPWPHSWPPPWAHRRRSILARFAVVLGCFGLISVGGMAALAILTTRALGTGRPTIMVVAIGGTVLGLVVPALAVFMAIRTFRGIAMPLADVMVASDRVAAGDLSARVSVPTHGPREFRRLSESFNHMTEELERADRQRRNLTADVAHELRTPLHIIQGNLEGVLDGVYEPTAEHTRATLDETRLLARLVEDLRTLSLAEAGQLPLVMEPVNVVDLLADVETGFSAQAEAGGISLHVDAGAASSASLVVTGDVGRLDQVLSNLMTNAMRHTPAGGTIALRAEGTPAGVRIVISDTGQGIASEDLPFIFDRFWRGDRSRSHASGAGSGLGLAIARQLVQAHGGTIRADSQPGRGTTFIIELPEPDGPPVSR
jgi:two-component system, OmpR family, sensor histidine kinase BaeS